MNWKQLYKAASYHERIDIMVYMLSTTEKRSRRRWRLVGGRFRRDRRVRHWHMVRDRRDPKRIMRWMYKGVFIYTLTTVSIATLVMLHGHPAFGAPLLCVYTFIIFAALLIKPIKRLALKNRKI